MVWRFLATIVVVGSWLTLTASAREPELIPIPSGGIEERLDGALGSLGTQPSPLTRDGQYTLEGPISQEPLPDESVPTCSTADNLRGSWFVDSDLMVLHRLRAPKSSNTNRALGEDLTIPTQITYITAADTEFNLAAGSRITLGHFIDSECCPWDRDLEFSFMGFFDFNTNTRLKGLAPHSIFTPIANYVGGFNGADVQTTSYRSTFNSYEWNYRFTKDLPQDRLVMNPDGNWHREINKGHVLSFLMGVRWISFNEDFEWLSRRNDQTVDVYRGDYNIHTKNDFVGVQIGGDLTDHHENWNWGTSLKGGMYADIASQTSDVLFRDPSASLLSVDRHERASKTIAAFEGEVGLFGNYHFNERWTLHAGYDFMFIRGLADATNQLHFDNRPTAVVVGSYQILTGGSLGLEFNW